MSSAASTLLHNIGTEILNPLVKLMIGAAVLYFIWGMYKFMRAGSDDTAKEEGRKHMVYGVIGLFVMVGVWGIINVIKNTLGLP